VVGGSGVTLIRRTPLLVRFVTLLRHLFVFTLCRRCDARLTFAERKLSSACSYFGHKSICVFRNTQAVAVQTKRIRRSPSVCVHVAVLRERASGSLREEFKVTIRIADGWPLIVQRFRDVYECSVGSSRHRHVCDFQYKQIRSIWKVLKCGAGEEWRRSVGPSV
jgi:hypothetical protein